MPDVRRACAAPVLGTGSTSPPSNIRAASRSSPSALSLAPRSPHRRLPEPAHIRSWPSQSSRRSPTARAHHRHGGQHVSHVSQFIPRLRPSGPSAFRSSPLRIGVREGPRDRRRPRNAQLHSTYGLGFHPGSSTHRQSRPGPVPRSSAAAVFLNPPRNHSVAPNPGMQRTRYARR